MSIFTYKAKDTQGRTIKDRISAQDAKAVISRLNIKSGF
jgi:type II secretory pathway component PulF